MEKEVIVALVLATLFLGAIAWLVIYSRLQNRAKVRSEQSSPVVREAGEVDASRGVATSRATKR